MSDYKIQPNFVIQTLICKAENLDAVREDTHRYRLAELEAGRRIRVALKTHTLCDELTPIGSDTVTYYACQKRTPVEVAARVEKHFRDAGTPIEVLYEYLNSIMAKRGLECPAYTTREAEYQAEETRLAAEREANKLDAEMKLEARKQIRRDEDIKKRQDKLEVRG